MEWNMEIFQGGPWEQDLLSIQLDCKKQTESGRRIRSDSISNCLGYGGREGFLTCSTGMDAESNGNEATGAGSSTQSETINLEERLFGVAVPLPFPLLEAEMVGVPTYNSEDIL